MDVLQQAVGSISTTRDGVSVARIQGRGGRKDGKMSTLTNLAQFLSARREAEGCVKWLLRGSPSVNPPFLGGYR